MPCTPWLAAKESGFNVIGLDIPSSMIEQAKRKIKIWIIFYMMEKTFPLLTNHLTSSYQYWFYLKFQHLGKLKKYLMRSIEF
nr:class I SAM-dependent methyltransferase [Piscirickettsia salmonis]